MLDDQKASNIMLTSQQVLNNVLTPKVPAGTVPPTPARVYFVELLLRNSAGTIVDRNVYWLSTQQDVVDWGKTLGVPQGTLSQYADLTGLQTLPAIPQPAISATSVTTTQSGLRHETCCPHGRAGLPCTEVKEEQAGKILRHRHGKFAYRSSLPADADSDKIDAELADGILTVRLPKAAQARSRRIEIKG